MEEKGERMTDTDPGADSKEKIPPVVLVIESIQRGLIMLARLSPKLAFGLADFYGRWGSILLPKIYNRPAEDRAKWIRLTGLEDRKALRKLRVRRSGRQRRRKVLESLLFEGKHKRLLPLVRWENPEHIGDLLEAGRPVIATTWHAGPFAAIALGVLGFRCPVTFLVGLKGLPPGIEDFEVVEIGTPKAAILAYKQSLKRLRRGGIVAMTGDQPAVRGEGIPVPLLNSRLPLKRGLAALSRHGRAPIVPVEITWSGTGDLVFKAHPPLATTLKPCEDPDTFELDVMTEFARLADAYFRRYPEEIDEGFWPELVRKGRLVPAAGSDEAVGESDAAS